MKTDTILHKLFSKGFLSSEEYQLLKNHYDTKLFSLYWELKSILYLGVMLLSAGLGILIYQNIDTIGHQALIILLGLVTTACFYYSFKRSKPYTSEEVKNENPFIDYILLLGCLLFLSLEGYLQFQYNLFGTRYGVAALLPALLFSFIAYRFDHKGVLSMAITALGSWMGITITPLDVFEQNFNTDILIYTGIGLGVLLISLSYLSTLKNIKKHFSFTYFNFGMQVTFISTLSGIFAANYFNFIYYLLLAGLCYLSYTYARREQSFYFLLMAVLYGYIGITYLYFDLLKNLSSFDMGVIYLGLFYFIISCIGIISFFFNYKKLLQR